MFKILYKIIAFGALASLLTTCQYPVASTELPDGQRFIVIEAELSEHYGRVSVQYTLDEVGANGAYLTPPPPQASAYVLDSQGNRKVFKTDGTRDSTFRGVVGETYRLYVTADGRSYESSPETMQACPEIEALTAIYTRESNRDPQDLSYDGFDVYAELNDAPGQSNYYQWDWVHYERTNTCAVVKEDDKEVLIPCNTANCWNISYNTRIITQADPLRDGQRLTRRIVRVPYVTPPYRYYYLRVEQRAITPTVFAYLQSLETQTQNVGSVFDIPAQTRFSPNIYNVEAPSEKIIGVFSVFSSRQKVINIDFRQEITGVKPKLVLDGRPLTKDPLAQAPCVEGLYRTQQRPQGWVD